MFQVEYQVVPSTNSSDELHGIQNIVDTSRESKPFLSERFPLYPINIILSVRGEPFNFVEVSCPKEMQPTAIQLQLSNDGSKYTLAGEMRFLHQQNSRGFVVRSLKLEQLVTCQFVRLQALGYLVQKDNICRQTGLYGVKLYHRKFEGTQFLYCLEAAHTTSRPLLEMLKCLEWTKCQAKADGNLGTCVDCQKQIEQLQKEYDSVRRTGEKERLYEMEREYLAKARKFHASTAKAQPKGSTSPPKKAEMSQPSLQKTSNLPVSKPTQPQPTAQALRNIFGKYANIVDQEKFKLLSSDRTIDHQKFLLELWAYLKQQPLLTLADEELMLDTSIHFLRSPEQKVVGLALQILNLTCKKEGGGKAPDKKYDELLSRLLQQWKSPESQLLRQRLEESLLSVYPLTKPGRYLDLLLNFPGERDMDKLKLTLLEHILNHNPLAPTTGPLNYLKQLFKEKDLPKELRSQAVQVLSIISERTSVDKVMESFKDLPTHVMLNIEKLIKEKLGISKQPSQRSPSIDPEMHKPAEQCHYCRVKNPSFLDADLYDLHCFRDCIYLAKCQYCQSIVEIPNLNSHYLKQCPQSKNFKKCGGCGLALHFREIDKHQGSECLKRQLISCMLCTANFVTSDELRNHILMKACPKNERALPPPPDK